LTLTTLRCAHEKESSPSPYLWNALVAIQESPLTVSVLTPPAADDRDVIQNDLHGGLSASIPSSVGVQSFDFDPATKVHLILVTALWLKHDTPGNAVDGGYRGFASGLQSAISANLIGLDSSDAQTRKDAFDAVKSVVKDSVSFGIKGGLSLAQAIEVETGLLKLDTLVDSSTMVFSSLASQSSQSFTITLGGPLGGRLLSYADDGTPGNVSDPVAVGFGSWSDFKFLFAGGNRIYAVNQNGQLLSYGDDGTPGNVSDPVIVGFDGWADFQSLFAGGNRIYAAEKGLTPDHHYEIDGTLQITADICVTEKGAVSAAQNAVQNINDQIEVVQAEVNGAVGPQRLALLQQIHDLEKKLSQAQATLDKAEGALAACLASGSS
jgi:hypothetical protein